MRGLVVEGGHGVGEHAESVGGVGKDGLRVKLHGRDGQLRVLDRHHDAVLRQRRHVQLVGSHTKQRNPSYKTRERERERDIAVGGKDRGNPFRDDQSEQLSEE